LARDGFVVADDTADTLTDMYRRMARWPNSARTFSHVDGTPLHDGDRLTSLIWRQRLSRLPNRGRAVFTKERLPKSWQRQSGCRRHHDG